MKSKAVSEESTRPANQARIPEGTHTSKRIDKTKSTIHLAWSHRASLGYRDKLKLGDTRQRASMDHHITDYTNCDKLPVEA